MDIAGAIAKSLTKVADLVVGRGDRRVVEEFVAQVAQRVSPCARLPQNAFYS